MDRSRDFSVYSEYECKVVDPDQRTRVDVTFTPTFYNLLWTFLPTRNDRTGVHYLDKFCFFQNVFYVPSQVKPHPHLVCSFTVTKHYKIKNQTRHSQLIKNFVYLLTYLFTYLFSLPSSVVVTSDWSVMSGFYWEVICK